MPEAERKLNGLERAAVLLLSLGEEAAAAVMKHMGPKEVQKVGTAMASLENISQAQVTSVMGELLSEASNRTSLGVGSQEYIRNVLVKALGEDKARGLMDRILLGGVSDGLDNLRWMDSRAIADMVRGEHPQIIAIVLAYLDSEQAAEVLSVCAPICFCEWPPWTRCSLRLFRSLTKSSSPRLPGRAPCRLRRWVDRVWPQIF